MLKDRVVRETSKIFNNLKMCLLTGYSMIMSKFYYHCDILFAMNQRVYVPLDAEVVSC